MSPADGGSPRLSFDQMVERVARCDDNVFACGGTGMGKEALVARLHALSDRRAEPYLPLSCANFTADLFDSQWFGYGKGSHSTASTAQAGFCEAVGRGTLFLDEIAELPWVLQAKLLRVLESRRYLRVGTTQLLPFDARVICATHRDLRAMVRAGTFREDLYHRLAVIILKLPGMDERLDEILPKLSEMLRQQGWDGDIAPCAAEILRGYTWAGGFREMKNVAKRLCTMGVGSTITADDIGNFAELDPEAMRTAIADDVPAREKEKIPAWVHPDAWAAADVCERAAWAAASEVLDRVGGNKSEAARQLRMTRPSLDRLIDRMANIKRPR